MRSKNATKDIVLLQWQAVLQKTANLHGHMILWKRNAITYTSAMYVNMCLGVNLLSNTCDFCGHKLMCPQCSDNFSMECPNCKYIVNKPALHNWTCPLCYCSLLPPTTTSRVPVRVDWGCSEDSDLSQ